MRALILLACVGCSPGAPTIVEVDSPTPTRDTHGPYRLAVSTTGAVNHVEATLDQQVFELQKAGSAYVGQLPGRSPGVTDVLISVEGPGGTATESRRLSIIDDRSVCLVDSDCPIDEHCNRLSRRCQGTEPDCADSGDCPADYICDTEAAECVFRPSGCSAASCPVGSVCEAGRCVDAPECAAPADCAPNEICAPPGRCIASAECQRNSDCPAQRPVCEDGVCVRPPEPCGGACPAGSLCVDDVCQPLDCEEDGLEDNDTLDAAVVIGNGARINGMACPGDADIFRVRMRSDESGVVTVGTNARLEVTLWSAGSPESQFILAPTDFELRSIEGIRTYVGVECIDCSEGAAYTIQTRFETE